jgi:hypothetical protein
MSVLNIEGTLPLYIVIYFQFNSQMKLVFLSVELLDKIIGLHILNPYVCISVCACMSLLLFAFLAASSLVSIPQIDGNSFSGSIIMIVVYQVVSWLIFTYL